MIRLILLTIFSLSISVSIFTSGKKFTIEESGSPLPKEWLEINKNPLTPKEDLRPADQTFLTYPEWFLVHSPKEEADYLEQNTSTTFPFIGHLEQLWRSYELVYKQIKNHFEFNTGYHVMIMVISVSTTVEYGLKSLYEKCIGRLTLPEKNIRVAEDELNAKFTRDYVNFILQVPWYEYDFLKQFQILWTETPIFGTNFFRKIERRYFLTTELLVKAFYGYLIKLGTKSAYETPLLNSVVITSSVPEFPNEKVKVLKKLDNEKYVLSLPRYAEFNIALNELSKDLYSFKEITGNNSAILLTVLIQKDLSLPEDKNYKLIFSQPILTKKELKRVAVCVLVKDLSLVLRKFQEQDVFIEHIYDF